MTILKVITCYTFDHHKGQINWLDQQKVELVATGVQILAFCYHSDLEVVKFWQYPLWLYNFPQGLVLGKRKHISPSGIAHPPKYLFESHVINLMYLKFSLDNLKLCLKIELSNKCYV